MPMQALNRTPHIDGGLERFAEAACALRTPSQVNFPATPSYLPRAPLHPSPQLHSITNLLFPSSHPSNPSLLPHYYPFTPYLTYPLPLIFLLSLSSITSPPAVGSYHPFGPLKPPKPPRPLRIHPFNPCCFPPPLLRFPSNPFFSSSSSGLVLTSRK